MSEDVFPMTKILALGVVALVAIAVGFSLIYWLLGRGKDDEGS